MCKENEIVINDKTLRVLVFTGIIVWASSCSGLKFNDITEVNEIPSANLKERSIWHDPSIIQYKLQSLSGYIIHKKANEQRYVRVIQILPTNFTPIPEPITDGELYHSVVDSRFALNGGLNIPLLSGVASVSATQTKEISIIDKALIHVDDATIPWEKLNVFIDSNPLDSGDTRYWVQAVMLTQIFSQTASNVESDQRVSGSAYQVGGKVYNANLGSRKQPFLTMLLIDIDKAKSRGGGIKILNTEPDFNAETALKEGRAAIALNLPLDTLIR